MSNYFATITWKRKDQLFTDNQYSREHSWTFDGGVEVRASSSPHIVPLPYSVEEAVDPEEAFVASLSSCHMLFFLSIAAKRKLVVDNYEDAAIGIMAKNENGKHFMKKVTLRPQVRFAGEKLPTNQQLEKIHHQAHELCFIANSVITDVVIEVAA